MSSFENAFPVSTSQPKTYGELVLAHGEDVIASAGQLLRTAPHLIGKNPEDVNEQTWDQFLLLAITYVERTGWGYELST